jgi:hypothetical protein
MVGRWLERLGERGAGGGRTGRVGGVSCRSGQADSHRVSAPLDDADILALAKTFASEALRMAALQHRRIRAERDDEVWAFWADLQFLVVSLQRLRQAAALGERSTRYRAEIEAAIAEFERELPQLRRMRNVGEHIDEYALGLGRDQTVERRALLVGGMSDDGDFEWLGSEINVDRALEAAETLYLAISDASRAVPRSRAA